MCITYGSKLINRFRATEEYHITAVLGHMAEKGYKKDPLYDSKRKAENESAAFAAGAGTTRHWRRDYDDKSWMTTDEYRDQVRAPARTRTLRSPSATRTRKELSELVFLARRACFVAGNGRLRKRNERLRRRYAQRCYQPHKTRYSSAKRASRGPKRPPPPSFTHCVWTNRTAQNALFAKLAPKQRILRRSKRALGPLAPRNSPASGNSLA